MNTLTRGEKIDRAIESAKRTAIKVMLILWGVVTIGLAIGFAGNYVAYKNLKSEYERIESEYNELNDHVEAIYVYRR